MSKIFSRRVVVFLAVILVLASAAAACAKEPAHQRRLRLAGELLADMAKEDDSGSFAESIQSSKAIAIFPALVRAGLGIGGMTGEGVVLVRGKGGKWLGPSFVSLVGGSIGLQIGVEKTGLVLCVINENGLPFFTGGQSFKLGGDVSVAAGPVGRSAQAATDTRAKASIYSYSMSEGAYAGLTLDGSTVNVNRDANKAYWGQVLEADAALAKQASGEKVAPLLKALKALDK